MGGGELLLIIFYTNVYFYKKLYLIYIFIVIDYIL